MNVFNAIANLTKDPELKFSKDGMEICKMGLAINSGWGDKKKTCFIDVTVFKNTAKNCAEFLKKGSKVGIAGELQFEQWEKEGVKRSKHTLIANSVEFLDSKSSVNTNNDIGVKNAEKANNDVTDEDIPF